MVKIWMGPTRQELASITRAARKLGVPLSQFIRNALAASNLSQIGKIPPQSAEDSGLGSVAISSTGTGSSKVPRKRKG